MLGANIKRLSIYTMLMDLQKILLKHIFPLFHKLKRSPSDESRGDFL